MRSTLILAWLKLSGGCPFAIGRILPFCHHASSPCPNIPYCSGSEWIKSGDLHFHKVAGAAAAPGPETTLEHCCLIVSRTLRWRISCPLSSSLYCGFPYAWHVSSTGIWVYNFWYYQYWRVWCKGSKRQMGQWERDLGVAQAQRKLWVCVSSSPGSVCRERWVLCGQETVAGALAHSALKER